MIRTVLLFFILMFIITTSVFADVFDTEIRRLHAKQVDNIAKQYAGKTLLIVNTASNCGYTPQFKQLEALYQNYKAQDFVILGFPSDDFFQEENDEKDTATVCYINYGVTFPMYNTMPVRGSDAHPIFAYLADKTTAPKWNFYKYLVSADRKTIKYFNSRVEPNSTELITAIESMLTIKQVSVQ